VISITKQRLLYNIKKNKFKKRRTKRWFEIN